jgi:aldehyde:ferredoxin oxidoreductase
MTYENRFWGYRNRILRVNLTNRTFSEETLNDMLIRNYIGGRGFGARLLYDDLKPGVDPLGGENEIIYLTGPMTGTKSQCYQRLKVTFKSPLTGGYFTSSAGGYFASEMKAAGFDVIIVEGQSDKPVFLWVHDGEYQLRDASYLWRLDCDDTHTLIREELRDPRIRISCIGPAGENQVRYAGIFTDRRAAGRGGGGAVMGSKNLKAIAVRGKGDTDIFDPENFRKTVKDQIRLIKTSETVKNFSITGTQDPSLLLYLGMYPTKNFQEGIMANWEQLDGSEYDKVRVRKTGCHRCMVRCGSISKIDHGNFSGAWSEGPEYETLWAFSGPTDTPDLGLTIAIDKLCDDLGLDTISTGVTIGFAYELFERGIISKEDTDGLELNYGNVEPIMELVRQIAYRKGFGNILAQGTRDAARYFQKGSEEFAMQVKGLELPGYDPRGAKAHGLSMLTSSIGADHCMGYSVQELFGSTVPKEYQRLGIEGKGELAKYNQDRTALMNTGIACNFMVDQLIITPDIYAEFLKSVTGIEELGHTEHLWQVGERIFNLERMFNIRENMGRKDDVYPKRFTKDPMPAGNSQGQVFEENELLEDYYMARGWDVNTGFPKAKKLLELGLKS